MATRSETKTAFVVFRYVSKVEDAVDAVKLFFSEESRRESVQWNVEVLSTALASGNVLLTGVLAAIKRADLVVVVAGEISHNVAFELGIAYGLSKELILLAPSTIVHEIPKTFSDIAGVKCAVYDPDRVMKIPEVLRQEFDALRSGRVSHAMNAISPEYLVALGDLFQAEGLITQAIAKYRAAVELEPHNCRYLVRLGQAYASNYELEAAEKYLRQATDADPSSAAAADAFGQCLLDGGQYLAGIELYSRLVEKYPDNEIYYFKIAVAYTELQQPDKAADFLAGSIATGVRTAGVYYDLAWTSVRASRAATDEKKAWWLQRAVDALRNAVQLSPEIRLRASDDQDFDGVRARPEFQTIIGH